VAVVSEFWNDDEAKRLRVRSKTFKGVDLAPKFQSFFSTLDPVTLVELTDDVEQFLTPQAIQIGLEGDEKLVIR